MKDVHELGIRFLFYVGKMVSAITSAITNAAHFPSMTVERAILDQCINYN